MGLNSRQLVLESISTLDDRATSFFPATAVTPSRGSAQHPVSLGPGDGEVDPEAFSYHGDTDVEMSEYESYVAKNQSKDWARKQETRTPVPDWKGKEKQDGKKQRSLQFSPSIRMVADFAAEPLEVGGGNSLPPAGGWEYSNRGAILESGVVAAGPVLPGGRPGTPLLWAGGRSGSDLGVSPGVWRCL